MLRSILFAAAVATIVAPVVVTADAMAGSSTSPETGKQHARLAARSVPQHHRQHVAHRAFARGFGNDSAAHYAVAPKTSVFHGPGYVNGRIYVLHKAFVIEACNLADERMAE